MLILFDSCSAFINPHLTASKSARKKATASSFEFNLSISSSKEVLILESTS